MSADKIDAITLAFARRRATEDSAFEAFEEGEIPFDDVRLAYSDAADALLAELKAIEAKP